MMTEKELDFVLSESEGLFVEFKERPDRSLAREIVAFANASGGRVFIGVSDDASIKGIGIDNRLLASLLMRTIYVEKMGTGVLRINQALQAAGLSEAEFSFDEFSFSITIHATEQVTPQVAPQATPQATPQVVELVRQISGDMSRDELLLKLKLKDRENFRKAYLKPALQAGLIEMTIPDKPQSGNQKYRLTETGNKLARNLQPAPLS